jgi:DNA excision repair protein ERCC-3
MIKYRIKGDYFEVTKRLIQRNIPIVQEFDFKNCKELQNIDMEMNSEVQLRFYQEAALKNVFIGGKARSGLIILPCGAGKSMVAI